MATIKTSGLYDRENIGSSSYDSGTDLNEFLFGHCGNGVIGVAEAAFATIGDVLDSLPNLGSDILGQSSNEGSDGLSEVALDGTTASGFDNGLSLSFEGKNLGALQEGGKGSATITSLLVTFPGFAVQVGDARAPAAKFIAPVTLELEGKLVVNAKGVASGTITSATYFDGEGTTVELGGKVTVKASAVTSATFTTASIDDGRANVSLTGKFAVDSEGDVDGAITSLTFDSYGNTQLDVTGIKDLTLGDLLDNEGFNFAEILSGNDTITVVYGDSEPRAAKEVVLFGQGYSTGATIEGFAGNDTLIGGDRNDYLLGDEGNDTLRAGDGDDRLDGGEGADSMTGGNGDDTYFVDNAKDAVVEAGGKASGADVVNLLVSEDFNVYKMAANVEQVFVLDYDEESGPIDVTITGNALNNYIAGGYGSDTLKGGAGNDVISGDSYFFGEGNDVIDGGTGNDVLFGGGGINTLTGGAGIDMFFHRVGSDWVWSEGTDTVTDFKSGTDKLAIDVTMYNGHEDVDSLATVGNVSFKNIFADDFVNDEQFEFEQLSTFDFRTVQNFDVDASFEKSGIYFDSVDGEVYYVEAYSDYDYELDEVVIESNIYLVATLDGVTQLKASDIVIVQAEIS